MYLRGRELLDERGSISVLTIGLFTILLTLALVLTDISSIYIAKRSLSLATEAAVQRGMTNLDAESYYSGEYNLNSMIMGAVGEGDDDPGIPIDCSKGIDSAQEVLDDWQGAGGVSQRRNVERIEIRNFQCDGFQIFIESSAIARIPIPIPFTNLDEVEISTHAGAIGERAETNNFYGFDFG